MERSLEVTTGESVAFSYELAGLGSRFLAVFIDLTIQVTAAVVLGLLLVAFAGAYDGAAARAFGKYERSTGIAIASFAAFGLFFGYFIIFEAFANGRTPGKRLVGIRVVRDGGYPVDLSGSVIRNVVRILEASLGFYVISAICALASPRNQRLGDMAGGTIVVREQQLAREPAIAAARADDPLVRELGAAERDLVLRYAARRAALADGPRRALAREIADVVRPRLAARFDHLDDDELLVHVAESALT